jgi:alanine racemase
MAVAKSNAYGHGLWEYSKLMQDLGADWIGVDSITEAVRLREEGITLPILILGYTLPSRITEAIENDVSITVSHLEHLEILKTKNYKLKTHLKIDTGMHRQGFLPEEIPQVIAYLKNEVPNVIVEGVYTHFPFGRHNGTTEQVDLALKIFAEIISQFKNAGFTPITHASASGPTLTFSDAHLDMIRSGISMYGLWSDPTVRDAIGTNITLKPALSWHTIISEIKTLKDGGSVGYDHTETVPPGTKLAVCPIGYWHGYPRALSSKAFVAINGKRAKVIGRVSMDIISIDVTNIPNIKIGDEVELIGQTITADELAEKAGTINYEIITRINPLIKRVYN